MYQLRFLLLGCFLLCAFSTKAQWKKEEVRVSLGEELNRSHQKGLHQMVGYDGSKIYTLQKKMTPFYRFGNRQLYTYLLQQYNADLELIQSRKLSLKKEGKSLAYEFILQVREDVYLFTSGYAYEGGKKKVFVQKIDIQSLEPEGAFKQVAEVEEEGLGGHFSWKLSEEKSKLLLLYTYNVGDRQTYDLYVFDNKMNELWARKDCIRLDRDPFALEQYEVDEDGNVYLLSTTFNEKRREKRAGTPDYAYHLTSYKENGRFEEQFGINLPGKFLTDIRIKVNKEQDIVGGGFYAGKGTYSLKGSYFFTIDGDSGKVIAKSVNPFKPDFIKEVIEKETYALNKEKEDLKLRKFGIRLNDILLREDGSAILLGEQYSLLTRTSIKKNMFNRTRTRSTYVYDFNDIIVVSMDEDGKEEWTRQIQKQQHSENDGGLYSSYRMNMVKGALYAVFNDNIQAKTALKKEKGISSSRPILVKVSRNGNQKTSVLSNIDRKGLCLLPQTGINTVDGEMVVLGSGAKRNRFIKLQINRDPLFTLVK